MTIKQMLTTIKKQYKHLLKPETFNLLIRAIEGNQLKAPVINAVLEKLEKVKYAIEICDEAWSAQENIYKKGIQELADFKIRAIKRYQMAAKKAEKTTQAKDAAAAEKLLAGL